MPWMIMTITLYVLGAVMAIAYLASTEEDASRAEILGCSIFWPLWVLVIALMTPIKIAIEEWEERREER
ncbi:hypothetical protein LCGC14_0317860 [marine sediment metagenome]|uniref:Uncharacterized protein n=1 Tax=marine sediment metagenome TaxID=412755 RepID=A0A0F9U2I6_9ZZZZ